MFGCARYPKCQQQLAYGLACLGSSLRRTSEACGPRAYPVHFRQGACWLSEPFALNSLSSSLHQPLSHNSSFAASRQSSGRSDCLEDYCRCWSYERAIIKCSAIDRKLVEMHSKGAVLHGYQVYYYRGDARSIQDPISITPALRSLPASASPQRPRPSDVFQPPPATPR